MAWATQGINWQDFCVSMGFCRDNLPHPAAPAIASSGDSQRRLMLYLIG